MFEEQKDGQCGGAKVKKGERKKMKTEKKP
jgi:hypothetical protein